MPLIQINFKIAIKLSTLPQFGSVTVTTTAEITVTSHCLASPGHVEEISSSAATGDVSLQPGDVTVTKTAQTRRMSRRPVRTPRQPVTRHTSGATQGNVYPGDGGATMTRTAVTAVTRSAARWRSSVSVPRRRGRVITGGVFTPLSGAMASLTVRTELTRCSVMSTAPARRSSSASSRPIVSSPSGGVTGRETAVTAVTRPTVLAPPAVQESSPVCQTAPSVSAPSGGVTGSRSVIGLDGFIVT